MNIENIEIKMTPQEFFVRHDCTNEEFAKWMGVARQTINRWKSGDRNVSRSHMREIAYLDFLISRDGPIGIKMTPQEFLAKHDYTNEKFADLIAVSSQTIDNWKSGKRNISKSHLMAIAYADYFHSHGGPEIWFNREMLTTKVGKNNQSR